VGNSRDVQRPQGMRKSMRPGAGGNGATESAAYEESQAPPASPEGRALVYDLMERVCHRDNLNRAFKRVRANKGAAGVDGMSVGKLHEWIVTHKKTLVNSLLEGRYEPQPVRGVQIPKPAGGGMRQLGIPTVVDRLVQQAILQVLEPILEPTFSAFSFGFRPKRSAHQALRQAQRYVSEGRVIVVDLDLEKFFDRVHHDVLMARVARHVGDKRLLRLIRRFLQAGMMQNGVCVQRHEGTPQGGPLSPLLANLLLDDLDKELERRGHCFCRYADDCNIYVRSLRSGERVMGSVSRFLEERLRLKVNREKSAVAYVDYRKFLGYRLLRDGGLSIAPASVKRMKERVRQITRRNRGVSFARIIDELNRFTTGWVTYFRLARCRQHLQRLDEWIRQKLRCYRLKQGKRAKGIGRFLLAQGQSAQAAWTLAASTKGWWRRARAPQAYRAMPPAWFKQQGLANLLDRYTTLQHN
jgi:RNA-directed DNA polymerase